ncbi:CLUMA_CG007015, isoform A [Clunio marinus]|uniref:CLUMA_CG007015, isoform A n=1 Tax=Clunio marinus TaxID=568069 RepID=A0A1J1HZE6_9DIPT|nr:CLUMA_CG007015, isoform A [Clunio marinus]
MEDNLEFLNKARLTFSKVIIEIGLQYLSIFPHNDLEEFLEIYMPPFNDIHDILKEAQIRIKKRPSKHKIKKKQASNRDSDSSVNKIIRKMSLYPSLEDMKVDQTIRAQKQALDTISHQHHLMHQHENNYPTLDVPGVPSAPPMGSSPGQSPVYPDLVNYMGLELSQDVIAANMPEYIQKGNGQVTTYVPPSMPTNMIAPLSGSSIGLARAGTTNGVRELILCKDGKGKVGLRAQSINKGVFVCVVVKDSPAAMAGLRFGDQILQINGATVAGFSVDDVHKLLKKSSHNNISVVIRDRPFERTVTLHKDSSNCVGFQFKNGKITSIVKDSSAARNGLLIEHQILEVDGQNVISMKDKEITKIIGNAGQVVTITIMPTFLYDHMMKKLSSSMIKDKMDHSIPDF